MNGIVFVANHAATVGNLCDITRSLTLIKPSMVPDLIVEHNDASGFPQVVPDFVLPLGAFEVGRRTGTEQMRTGNHLGAAIFNFGNIGQVVVRREEQHRKADVFGRLPIRDSNVRGIILVPTRNAAARRASEGVVVYDVAVWRDERLGETDSGFQIKKPEDSLRWSQTCGVPTCNMVVDGC